MPDEDIDIDIDIQVAELHLVVADLRRALDRAEGVIAAFTAQDQTDEGDVQDATG